jgi:dipeptidyl aminopeptidase/acylaminoacyl peptidase
MAIAGAWSLGTLTAQTRPKRPISYDVYDYWKSIGGTRLSRDGQWLAYSTTSQGEDGEMIVRNLKSGQEFREPRGASPTFTPDGKFMLFTITPPKAEEEAAASAGGAATEPPAAAPAGGGRGGQGGGAGRGSLGIMTLPDGKVTTIDRAANYRIPEDSSTWIAYHKSAAGNGRAGGGRAGGGAGGRGGGTRGGAAAGGAAGGGAQAGAGAPQAGGGAASTGEKRKDPGTDLFIRNLVTGNEVTVPEVTDFQWNKDGSWLVYGVSSTDAAKDGAFARRTSDAAVTSLHTGKGNYRSFVFDDAGKQLAFVSDQAEYDKKVSPYRAYLWKTGEAAASEIISSATKGIPAGMILTDGASRFSQDGARLFVSTAPPPPPTPEPGAKAPTRVDLWSYKDPQIQPMQQVRAAQDRARSYRAVYYVAEKRFVQLATTDLPNVNPGEDAARSLGTSDLPYQQEMSWDQTYNDVYLVDLKTGGRKKILEHWGANTTLSPGGNYVLYFDEEKGNWFTYKVADGSRVNLTGSLPVKFFDEGHDTPSAPPSLGTAGWTEGDKSVLLNDEFDIWEIHPDGTGARMVTNGEGRNQKLVFRYRPPFDAESAAGAGPGGAGGGGGRGGGGGNAGPISTSKPVTLTTTNYETRASGFYRTNFTGTAAPEKIFMIDKQVGAPQKARDADVMVFTEQKFDEFPDLWVTDTKFSNPQKVSNANPQQSEFIWGKAERIKYINTDGKVLGAILVKPENFDPSKKYPLMVYIYEELSEGLHGYRAPNVGTSINLTRYVSNGYVVLEPDIVYETGYPGPSAMKCVIPAINTVVAQGYIDPKRVGIQGHSWGGYQITYMITQTDIFAAVEAGASVSNMISAYGGIRWGTGMVREFQYEKTQSRIGSTPWDAPLQFIENSPIFWIERIHTPYLTIHNDADDAVPWYQGIEFNTAMRRLGKEAYMFSFNGEPHGLRNRDNMKYWTVHMDEFFDHFLLGKPKPEWMDKGVPFLQKGTRDVSPLFKKVVLAPAPGSKGGGQ